MTMNHYDILGVKFTASKDEIKKAYHKQALIYHPDKNRESNAEDRFRTIKEAYAVLVDDHKRELYDRFDLPLTRSSSRHRSSDVPSQRQRHDEQFFTGPSDAHRFERQYQNELERIRRINADLLDETNAKLGQPSRSDKWKKSSSSGMRNSFKGDIMPDEPIDEYEKIVLSRLRSLNR